MFIETAKVFDLVPSSLLDRMEIIDLSGYSAQEKNQIACDFLLPKLLKEHNLDASKVTIDPTALMLVIEEYSKEAGVRQLERVLAKLLRKCIQVFLADKEKNTVTVTPELLEEWLGNPPFKLYKQEITEQQGIATGLAWTELGGDVLEIEVGIMKGKGALSLTGQLGEVMQESAQAALSYIRTRAKEFGLKESFYSDYDIHVHIPEGAIPKDGPSAGITMAIALISAFTKIDVAKGVAMTGEITLRGRVLPVGGLKEKLLAAARHDMTTVIVPKENEADIKEVLKECDPNVSIVYASTMDEVIQHALTQIPTAKKRRSTAKK